MRSHCWISLLFAALLLGGCSGDTSVATRHEFAGQALGTTYHITIVAPADRVDLEVLEQGSISEIDNVDQLMSTWKGDSELTRFNLAASTNWVPVSEPLFTVLARAQEISSHSGGAFDITVGPLVDLWGFGVSRIRF